MAAPIWKQWPANCSAGTKHGKFSGQRLPLSVDGHIRPEKMVQGHLASMPFRLAPVIGQSGELVWQR